MNVSTMSLFLYKHFPRQQPFQRPPNYSTGNCKKVPHTKNRDTGMSAPLLLPAQVRLGLNSSLRKFSLPFPCLYCFSQEASFKSSAHLPCKYLTNKWKMFHKQGLGVDAKPTEDTEVSRTKKWVQASLQTWVLNVKFFQIKGTLTRSFKRQDF